MTTVTSIDLTGHVGTGLIVLAPSRVQFEHQCGGTSCLQRSAEGFFVPIGNDVEVGSSRLFSIESELDTYFQGPRHRGTGAVTGLSEQDADFIDGCLATSGWFRGIAVDRDRLEESVEAWVYVRVAPDAVLYTDLLRIEEPGSSAVLVWTNSD